jgi:hypothetical protein
MGLPVTPSRLGVGELSVEPSELVSAVDAVTFTCGGTYCVFRLLLLLRGISSSSSDHSPSASPNGLGRLGSMSGDTVLADGGSSSWTTSAEGQVNLRERRVEKRTSVVEPRSVSNPTVELKSVGAYLGIGLSCRHIYYSLF